MRAGDKGQVLQVDEDNNLIVDGIDVLFLLFIFIIVIIISDVIRT